MIAYTHVAEAEWGQMDNGDSVHFCSASTRQRCAENQKGAVWHKRSACFAMCHAVEISEARPAADQGS
jgi:hypothetical protein